MTYQKYILLSAAFLLMACGRLSRDEQLQDAWNRAMEHQALGMSLAEDEQLPEAIAYYRTDVDKLADSYLLEASYLQWTNKEDEAVKAIDRGIEVIADSAKRVRLLGMKAAILEHQREYQKAVEVLRTALGYDLPTRE